MRYVLPIVAMSLILVCRPVVPAMAHAVLLETIPEDSVRLNEPPSDIRLRFNEPVQPISVHLIAVPDRAIDTALETRDAMVLLVPNAPLPKGGYLVEYRVASRDGHPVTGTIGFGVQAAPPAEEGAVEPEARWQIGLAVAARALNYGGILAAVGCVMFLVLVARMKGCLYQPLFCIAGWAFIAALTGVVAGIILAGAGVAGSSGLSLTMTSLGLVVFLSSRAFNRRLKEPILLIAAMIAAASLAVTGHAATAPPWWVSLPAVAIHVLAASYWVGSLLPLLVVLRSFPVREAAAMVWRFSRIALILVPLLILAGGMLSLAQFAGIAGFAGYEYGWLWLIKMTGVAAMLGLASFNRLRLTPALESGDRGAAKRLILSVRAELVIAVLVVAATAGLSATPPPRALALAAGFEPEPAAATGYTTLVTTPTGSALVEIDPARVGQNRLTIRVSAADFGLGEAKNLWAVLSREQEGLSRKRFPLTASHAGLLIEGPINLPESGRWTVTIETGRPEQQDQKLRLTVPISESTTTKH